MGRPTSFDAVDHITPKSLGGTDDPDNLELICESCHAEKTQREALEAQGKTLKPRATFDEFGRVVW
jgi:5-methylcytosine-specific restriction protein A